MADKWDLDPVTKGELNYQKFHRHILDIEEIFNITIKSDSQNRYYIFDTTPIYKKNSIGSLLKSLSFQRMYVKYLGIRDLLLLSQVIANDDIVYRILEALKRGRKITIEHKKLGEKESSPHELSPACIKQYRNRLYLLASYGNSQLYRFDINRIKSVKIEHVPSDVPEDFDADEYFRDFYGITKPEGEEMKHIIIRAFGTEQFLLEDDPLHHSQRLYRKGDGFCDYELFLIPTLEFYGMIISRSKMIKVLEPVDIKEKTIKMLKETLNLYVD
jgi:hypothetical protein